jgi:hypothetical protein
MVEGDKEKNGGGDGQERNRDDSLLAGRDGKNYGQKTRELGNLADGNEKLYPAHAESDEGFKRLFAEMKRPVTKPSN